MLGEAGDGGDQVAVLSCNLDDMTAEALGFAVERLFEAGARFLIWPFCQPPSTSRLAWSRLIFCSLAIRARSSYSRTLYPPA